jgi:hypothetical protein
MRVRALVALTALSAALAATAAPASAQTYGTQQPYYGDRNTINQDAYCAQVRQNRMMVGGAIGAAIGAVLGNNLAARNAQTEGAGLGGVAGAATGAIIGRNTGQCSPSAQRRTQQQAYGGYQQPYPQQGGYQPSYQPAPRDDYPLEGGPDYRGGGYRTSGGRYDAPQCQWGSVTTRDPYGREVRESIYMCRGADGVWRPQ